MIAKERDELLIRLDERQKQILDMNISQEKHLATLNDKVYKNIMRIAQNSERIGSIEKVIGDGVPIRFTNKQYVAGGISAITLLSTLALTACKLLGWL